MDNKDQSKTVNNDGVTFPEHDYAGLSQVISSAKPSLPGTENGFIPVTSSDLSKPYEVLENHLKEQQARLDNGPIDPANAIKELQDEIKDIETKRDNVLDKRIDDYEKFYEERRTELNDYHAEVLRLKDEAIQELHNRVVELRERNTILEGLRDSERDLRLNELQSFHDQRMADLEQYHANELALTERFTQLMEQKNITDEQRVREAEQTLLEDRKNIFKTILDSAKELKLTRLFR